MVYECQHCTRGGTGFRYVLIEKTMVYHLNILRSENCLRFLVFIDGYCTGETQYLPNMVCMFSCAVQESPFLRSCCLFLDFGSIIQRNSNLPQALYMEKSVHKDIRSPNKIVKPGAFSQLIATAVTKDTVLRDEDRTVTSYAILNLGASNGPRVPTSCLANRRQYQSYESPFDSPLEKVPTKKTIPVRSPDSSRAKLEADLIERTKLLRKLSNDTEKVFNSSFILMH